MKTVAVFVALTLAACAAESGDPSPASPPSVCEPGVTEKKIATNGVQSNGIQSNRIALNGTDVAGVRVAGVPSVGATVTAVMRDGRTVDLTVGAAEGDRFELTLDGKNVCEDGTKGLFVPGVWDERGAHHDSSELSTFACATGAIGKCVLWGYAPDRVGAELHQACTRMVRADYCGDGTSFTKDGTQIDVFDARGIVAPANEASFLFEAGWGENGAVCVSRTRFEGSRPSCWKDLPLCASGEEAASRGALVMNASRRACL